MSRHALIIGGIVGVPVPYSERTASTIPIPPGVEYKDRYDAATGIFTHADGRPFHLISDPPFEHDVQLRIPDVRKSRDVLGFEATTTLSAMLDEVIPWIAAEIEAGRL